MVVDTSVHIWKFARRLGGRFYRTRVRRDVPILTFHRIREGDGITLETLERVLDFVASDFNTITLVELTAMLQAGTRLPRNHIVLTFDDATADHFTHVAPALTKRGLRGSFGVIGCTLSESSVPPLYQYCHIMAATSLDRASFGFAPIVPGQWLLLDHNSKQRHMASSSPLRRAIQGSNHALATEIVAALGEALMVEPPLASDLFMTLDQIETLRNNGHEIAAHSLRHQDVGEPSMAQWENDLKENFAIMQELFGPGPHPYIYPFGKERRPTVHAKVRQAGFCCACTSQWGTNLSGTDPFTLQRTGVSDETRVPFDVIY